VPLFLCTWDSQFLFLMSFLFFVFRCIKLTSTYDISVDSYKVCLEFDDDLLQKFPDLGIASALSIVGKHCHDNIFEAFGEQFDLDSPQKIFGLMGLYCIINISGVNVETKKTVADFKGAAGLAYLLNGHKSGNHTFVICSIYLDLQQLDLSIETQGGNVLEKLFKEKHFSDCQIITASGKVACHKCILSGN